MKSIKQREVRRKYKYALFVLTFSLFSLFSGVYPLIDWGDVKEEPKPVWCDPTLADYLYEDDIDQTSYSYNVSYGLNIIPIDFGTHRNQSKAKKGNIY